MDIYCLSMQGWSQSLTHSGWLCVLVWRSKQPRWKPVRSVQHLVYTTTVSERWCYWLLHTASKPLKPKLQDWDLLPSHHWCHCHFFTIWVTRPFKSHNKLCDSRWQLAVKHHSSIRKVPLTSSWTYSSKTNGKAAGFYHRTWACIRQCGPQQHKLHFLFVFSIRHWGNN